MGGRIGRRRGRSGVPWVLPFLGLGSALPQRCGGSDREITLQGPGPEGNLIRRRGVHVEPNTVGLS